METASSKPSSTPDPHLHLHLMLGILRADTVAPPRLATIGWPIMLLMTIDAPVPPGPNRDGDNTS
jgi:hypothetical protein